MPLLLQSCPPLFPTSPHPCFSLAPLLLTPFTHLCPPFILPRPAIQVGLWVFGGVLGIDAVTAAIMGLSALLITGVVTWKECLLESVAWDTLTWFAALIAMANYLNKFGLIAWFSQTVVKVSLWMGVRLMYMGGVLGVGLSSCVCVCVCGLARLWSK